MDSETIKEKINTEQMIYDPENIILLSLTILLFTILIWWWFSRIRHVRQSVLMTGLSESGKTLIFVQMCYGHYGQTYTSMKENIEDFPTKKETLKVIDLPGQERLRNKFFDKYKNSAKGIIFVVDSVTIQKEIRDVAEYLYTILSDPVIQKNACPFLIACNKQDQPLAKGRQVIQSLLEKEINLVRVTKSSQLQSVDASQSNKTMYLGKIGKDFEFSHLNFKVNFVECSANTINCGESDRDGDSSKIIALESWILKL